MMAVGKVCVFAYRRTCPRNWYINYQTYEAVADPAPVVMRANNDEGIAKMLARMRRKCRKVPNDVLTWAVAVPGDKPEADFMRGDPLPGDNSHIDKGWAI